MIQWTEPWNCPELPGQQATLDHKLSPTTSTAVSKVILTGLESSIISRAKFWRKLEKPDFSDNPSNSCRSKSRLLDNKLPQPYSPNLPSNTTSVQIERKNGEEYLLPLEQISA